MTAQRPLLLANALVVDPAAGTQVHGGLLVRDGLIADAGPHLTPGAGPEGAETVDCGGAVVAPGLVDMRCFVGEPGYEYRETIASATAAAAAGGVTTLVSQPATDPAVDDPAIVDFLLRRARDTGIVRFHPMAAITKKLAGREMTEFGLLQEAGAVAFTDGARSVTDALVMRRAMTYARDFDALIVHHTEEPTLVGEGVMNEGEFASRLGLAGIPVEAETIMLERDMRLVKLTGARYHAASVTCRDSLAIIARAKNEGLPVTASVTINHLTLNENDIGSYRTFCKLSPPLRTEDDRLALADAVADGTIDVVVSDHDPQDVETKRPSPRRPPARWASRPCCPRPCGWSMPASCRWRPCSAPCRRRPPSFSACPVARWRAARPPISWSSISRRPGYSTATISGRSARTRPSTRRA